MHFAREEQLKIISKVLEVSKDGDLELVVESFNVIQNLCKLLGSKPQKEGSGEAG